MSLLQASRIVERTGLKIAKKRSSREARLFCRRLKGKAETASHTRDAGEWSGGP